MTDKRQPLRNAKNGKLERSIDTAERDAEAARMRAKQMTYAEIGRRLGIDASNALRAVQRAREAAVADAGRESLAAELVKLDMWESAAWAVLEANHLAVSDGRVVKLDDQPLTDHKPVLMAIDRLLRISERRSRLLGLDAPSKQTITVLTEDVVDAAIREELAAMEALDAADDASRSAAGEAPTPS